MCTCCKAIRYGLVELLFTNEEKKGPANFNQFQKNNYEFLINCYGLNAYALLKSIKS